MKVMLSIREDEKDPSTEVIARFDMERAALDLPFDDIIALYIAPATAAVQSQIKAGSKRINQLIGY